MKQVLLLTDVDFWRQGAGHRMRIASLINYLIQHVRLTIVYLGIIGSEEQKHLSNSCNFKLIVLKRDRILDYKEYGELLKKKLKAQNFNSVIIEFIHNTYYLNFVNEDARFILDTHDIISKRTAEFQKFNYPKRSYEMSEETEFRIFNVYQYIIAICKPDYDELTKYLPEEKVLLCPHPMAVKKRALKNKVKTIGFIASEYLPNVDGIQFFINECWPGVLQKHDVNLCLYGNICQKVNTEGRKNIKKIGFVENLAEVYDEIDIIINPVRFGGGLKIKSIECLANGIPLLTTSHGARGLELMFGKAFLVAENEKEFVDKLNLLIETLALREELCKNALQYVDSIYNEKICFKSLVDAINS